MFTQCGAKFAAVHAVVCEIYRHKSINVTATLALLSMGGLASGCVVPIALNEDPANPSAKVTSVACRSTVAPPTGSAWAAEGVPGHHHDDSFSDRGSGDAKKPARIVKVTMGEVDGRMMFMPAKVDVKEGEQIKFMLRNNGELDHEFVLGCAADHLQHVKAMKANPDIEHIDTNARRLAPKKSSEIVWKFNKPGEFEFACLIPGHREAGMVGIVVAK